ncbi:hypothetical protein [Crocosphaera sp. XPORK-15E]|uniref:hypothetical protein n=1 Tax=Crocosphaera sp. XPORK-15E TaxID=3110247 RepID=UPI002B219BC3|nr:hypothetical protein [Crocosphaera sp. XPORK-15E]MEA5536494.1 hypothetical protein [Crocosphaera sp. XPORK-15E]
MTAARDYSPTPSRSRSSRRRRLSAPSNASQSSPRPSQVTPLPQTSQQLPLALQFLLLVQKSSTTITCCLVMITLAVYGWTVYAPTLWTKEFSKLKTLQRNERQLASTNETLKHKMAQQAEQPGSGLTEPNPNQSLFLSPAEVPKTSVPVTPTSTEAEPLMPDSPIAY